MKFLTLIFALIFCSVAALGQPSENAEYKKARNDYNHGDMEDACSLFKKLNAESPSEAQQTNVYMIAACNALSHMRAAEQSLYIKGVAYFNQGDYPDAKIEFLNALKVQLKTLSHRGQINQYLAQIQAMQNRQFSLKAAVGLFNQGHLKRAQSEFEKLAKGNGQTATEAKSYLAQISQARANSANRKRADQVYNEGMKFYQEKRYADARSRFEDVLQMKDASEQVQAAKMIGMIDQIANAGPAGAAPAPKGALRDELRAGLEAYFNANYDEADRDLTDYINHRGSKLSLAYFFRGAAHGAQYFLSGKAGSKQKGLALADFRQAHAANPSFQPTDDVASPKLLNLYSQSLTSSQQ